jgi:6-pyruvoyltetrahydropterin/6-carboxytetrahydropterin synthase
MYILGVRREFIARHFLIGGDWGPENLPNSHVVGMFKEKMLNDCFEFAGLNPSIEHFARILAMTLSEKIKAKNITNLKVVLWENDSAWAAFRVDRLKG